MPINIWSASQSCWPLWNIIISNNNRSSTVYVYVFCPLSLPRLLPNLTVDMGNTAVSYKAGSAYPSRAHEFTPGFFCLGPCCSWFTLEKQKSENEYDNSPFTQKITKQSKNIKLILFTENNMLC